MNYSIVDFEKAEQAFVEVVGNIGKDLEVNFKARYELLNDLYRDFIHLIIKNHENSWVSLYEQTHGRNKFKDIALKAQLEAFNLKLENRILTWHIEDLENNKNKE